MKKLLKSRVLSSVLSIVMLLTLVNGVPAIASKVDGGDTQVSLASQLIAEGGIPTEVKPDLKGVVEEVTPKQEVSKPPVPKPEAPRVLASAESTLGQFELVPAQATVKSGDNINFDINANYDVPPGSQRLNFKFRIPKYTESGSTLEFVGNIPFSEGPSPAGEQGYIYRQGYYEVNGPGLFKNKPITIKNTSGAKGDTITLTMEVWLGDDTSNKVVKEASVNIETDDTVYDLKRFNEGFGNELYKADGWYNAKKKKYYASQAAAQKDEDVPGDAVKGRFYSFVSVLDTYSANYYIIDSGAAKLDLAYGVNWDLEYSLLEDGAIQQDEKKKPIYIGARFLQEYKKAEHGNGINDDLINFQNFPMERVPFARPDGRFLTISLFSDLQSRKFVLHDRSLVNISPSTSANGTSVLKHEIKGDGENARKHNVYGIGFVSLFFLPEPANDSVNRELSFELKNLRYRTYNGDVDKTDKEDPLLYRGKGSGTVVWFKGKEVDANTIKEVVEPKNFEVLKTATVSQAIESERPPILPAGRQFDTSAEFVFDDAIRKNAETIDVNQLVKFDADYFKPIETSKEINKDYSGTSNLLYATKRDGSNWTSGEIFAATSGDLVYYSDVKEAQKEGRKVVGYLFEYRGGTPGQRVTRNRLRLTNDLTGRPDNATRFGEGKAGVGLMVLNTEAWINESVPSYKPDSPTEAKDASTLTLPQLNPKLTKYGSESEYSPRTKWDDETPVSDDQVGANSYNGKENRKLRFEKFLEYKFTEWEVALYRTTVLNGTKSGNERIFNIKDGERTLLLANNLEGRWVGEGSEPDNKPSITINLYKEDLHYFVESGQDRNIYRKYRNEGRLSRDVKLYMAPKEVEVELVSEGDGHKLMAKNPSEQDLLTSITGTRTELPMGKRYTIYQIQTLGNQEPEKDIPVTTYAFSTRVVLSELNLASTRGVNSNRYIEALNDDTPFYFVKVTREGKGGFSGFKGASKVKPKDDVNPVNFRYFAENPEKDNSDFFFFTVLPFNGEKRKDTSKPVSSNIPEKAGAVDYSLLGNKVFLKQAYGRPLPTLDLYYTLDKGVRTKGADGAIPDASDVDKTHPENSFSVNWTKAPAAVDGTNEKVYTLNLSEGHVPTAFILKGNFKKDTNFEFNFSLSQNQANKANDEAALYVNEASAYFGQDAGHNDILLHSQKSRMTQTKVVTKTIKGTIERKNGTGYAPASSLMVELKDAVTGTTLRDVYGNDLRTQTNSNGAYVFKDMVDNQNGYKVVVVSGLAEKEYVKDKAGSAVTTSSLNPFTRLVASISNTFRVLASGNQSENTPITIMPTFDTLVNAADDKASEVITKNLEIATLAKSITGAVFADANGDGNNTGENVPSGTKVELFKNDSINTPIGSEVTSFGENGSFTFSDIPEGEVSGENSTYRLRFTFPEGYNKANQFYTGSAVTTPTKVNANSVFEKVVTLKSFAKLQALSKGTDTAEVKLGVATVEKAITGTVYKDGTAADNVTVTLLKFNGSEFVESGETQNTTSGGKFSFTNPVDAEKYKVKVADAKNGEFVVNVVGNNSKVASTTDEIALGTYKDLLNKRTLTKRETVNFLYSTASKTIKGKVTLPGVTDYSAYTVTLQGKTNSGFENITNNISGTAYQATLNSDGTYEFANPADAKVDKTYKVVVGGFVKKANQFGDLETVVTEVDSYSDIFNAYFTSNTDKTKLDKALLKKTYGDKNITITERSKTIKGTVKDRAGKARNAVTVSLYEVKDSTGTTEKLLDATTNAKGEFAFKNPKDSATGKYLVKYESTLKSYERLEVKADGDFEKGKAKEITLPNFANITGTEPFNKNVEFRITELSKTFNGHVMLEGKGTDKFKVQLLPKDKGTVLNEVTPNADGSYSITTNTDGEEYVIRLVKVGSDPEITYDYIQKTTIGTDTKYSKLPDEINEAAFDKTVPSQTFDEMWAGTSSNGSKTETVEIDLVKVTKSISGKVVDNDGNAKKGAIVEIWGKLTKDAEETKIKTLEITSEDGAFNYQFEKNESFDGKYTVKLATKPGNGEVIYYNSKDGQSEEGNSVSINLSTRIKDAENGTKTNGNVSFQFKKATKVIEGSVTVENGATLPDTTKVELYVDSEKIGETGLVNGKYSFNPKSVAADNEANGTVTYKVKLNTTLAVNEYVRISDTAGVKGSAAKTLETTLENVPGYKKMVKESVGEVRKTVNFTLGKIEKSIKVVVKKDSGNAKFADAVPFDGNALKVSLLNGTKEVKNLNNASFSFNENEKTTFLFANPKDVTGKYKVKLELTNGDNEVFLFVESNEAKVGASSKEIEVSLGNYEALLDDSKEKDRTAEVHFLLKRMKKHDNPTKSIFVQTEVQEKKGNEFKKLEDVVYEGAGLTLTDGSNNAVNDKENQAYAEPKTDAKGEYTFLNPADKDAYKVGLSLKEADKPYYTVEEPDTNNITLKSYYDLKYDQGENADGSQTATKKFIIKRFSKTIEGTLWDDKNKNGQVDPGENPFANVEIILTDDKGNEITHDYLGNKYDLRTDSNGNYKIPYLPEKDGYKFKFKIDENSYSHINYIYENGKYDEKTGEIKLPSYDDIKAGKEDGKLSVNLGLIKKVFIIDYVEPGPGSGSGTDSGSGSGAGSDSGSGSGAGSGSGSGSGAGSNPNQGSGSGAGSNPNSDPIIIPQVDPENPPYNPPVVKEEDDFFIPPFVIENDKPATVEPEVTDIDVEDVPLGDADLNLDVLDDELPQGAGNIKPGKTNSGKKDSDKKDLTGKKDSDKETLDKSHSGGKNDEVKKPDNGKTGGNKIISKILAKTGGENSHFVFAGLSLLVLMFGFIVVEIARKKRANKR